MRQMTSGYVEPFTTRIDSQCVFIHSYGVTFRLDLPNLSLVDKLYHWMPPCSEICSSADGEVSEVYSIISEQNTHYSLYHQEECLLINASIDDVLDVFEGHLRLRVAVLVENRLFIHAGVVAWQDKAIVIPGRSYSGKTTLVAALMKTGAVYYSDEYAVLDCDGLVHPYSRPLSIRDKSGTNITKYRAQELGGISGKKPIPIGWIVHTHYEPQAEWHPVETTSAQALLALFDNTVVAQIKPDYVLPILADAVSEARSIQGVRGDANEVSKQLLQDIITSSL